MKKIQHNSLEDQIALLEKDKELFLKHFETQRDNLLKFQQYIKNLNFKFCNSKKNMLLHFKSLFPAELGFIE